MCLNVNNKTPIIAENDIECYKVYKYTIRHEYVAPFQGTKMPVIGELTISEIDGDSYYIEKGFHSFVYFDDAKEFKNDYHNFAIFRCIIPKGAKYYQGFFVSYESYCSDMIIVKEEVYV